MIIRAIRLQINTIDGPYGFAFSFSRNLTVIRGNNSSGKSTFFNALLYALGMEELIGGKGEHVLPYAVRAYFDDGDRRVDVISSEVSLELENRQGDVVTLRRPIKDDVRESKLVEIANGSVLTQGVEFKASKATYLHDPGGAQRQEGFHRFLEGFLGLHLPKVAATNSPEVKLYLQAIFAAHAVEQKRGWTDYIANIPFYGIRDARTRVAEYILGLGVFETISKRNALNAEAVVIDQDWRRIAEELRQATSAAGVLLSEVSVQPKGSFDPDQVKLLKPSESDELTLTAYIGGLLAEHKAISKEAVTGGSNNEELLKKLESAEQWVQSLIVYHERATSSLSLQRASLSEYEELFNEAHFDLDRNKAAKKLQELGADQAIELASGLCPTCFQPVEDTLLRESLSGHQMDLDTNIAYLDSQSRMLERQIAGLKQGIEESLVSVADIAARLAARRDHVTALRADLGSTAFHSKASVRRQVQIEVEVEGLQRLEENVTRLIEALKQVADRLAANQLARRDLPPKQYSASDEIKIEVFEKNFRANAGSFGYESVSNLSEVQISRESLVPGLEQIELREILTKRTKTDIKADSSASDFVRLIWSYLLGLYQTSSNSYTPGNHLGILLFDEPGQHSMRWESQRELLLRLAGQSALQSIVAASFDESESVFKDVTNTVRHELISWEGKLIRSLKGTN